MKLASLIIAGATVALGGGLMAAVSLAGSHEPDLPAGQAFQPASWAAPQDAAGSRQARVTRVASVSAGTETAEGGGAHPAVVVELYTSQGCSSCPPADEILAQLAGHDGVIPLALHVNYWDYIGWKDEFGSQQYTDRQRAYARATGSRMIYTPQIIVDGEDRVAGARAMDVAELIRQHAAEASPVQLTLLREGDKLTIAATSQQVFPSKLSVDLVRYLPERTVQISRGENAGRSISYHNIVTSWTVVGSWDGSAPMQISAAAPGGDPIVVILQRPGPGEIVAAATLP